MYRIGEFIYPWGNGHYSRMSRLNEILDGYVPGAEVHYSSKGDIYERLRRDLPEGLVHRIMMPTPIDGQHGARRPEVHAERGAARLRQPPRWCPR